MQGPWMPSGNRGGVWNQPPPSSLKKHNGNGHFGSCCWKWRAVLCRRRRPKTRQDKTPKPLKEGSTQKYKVPKIQRLITPAILQRRRHLAAIKRRCQEKSWQQDLGTETEGAERAEGAAEKEVRFPESEQDIRLQ